MLVVVHWCTVTCQSQSVTHAPHTTVDTVLNLFFAASLPPGYRVYGRQHRQIPHYALNPKQRNATTHRAGGWRGYQ